MVTSIFTSMFTSTNTSLKSRIQTIQNAEEKLLEFACKMGDDNDNSSNGSSSSNDVDIRIFDTIINKSSLSCFNNNSKEDVKCLLLGLNNPNYIVKENDTNSCCNDKQADGDDELVIHGIHAESKDNNASAAIPLVLLHGYANGALYFYRNMKQLAKQSHIFSGIYAIDMLGWGLSSRPNYNFANKRIKDVEAFYVDSIEEWRIKNNIKKMHLGGHSLGGYIAVAYGEKYPQNIGKLILMSPVGVPNKTKEEEDMEIQKIKNSPFTFRMMASAAMTFWSNGLTHGSVIRAFPEKKGRSLVEGYIQKRLPNITDEDEQNALTDYLYYNAKLPGSGEYCLNKLLKPMAVAYKPLLHRIPKLQIKDITILYGEKDWMDPTGGADVVELCNSMKENGVKVTPNVNVNIVKNAGHLLMLENWEEFNNAVIQSVTNVQQPQQSSSLSSSIDNMNAEKVDLCVEKQKQQSEVVAIE